MMTQDILLSLQQHRRQGRKLIALLIDPDKTRGPDIATVTKLATQAGTKLILVGGSLLTEDALSQCIDNIKANTHIPVVIFPGDALQISPNADALLLLSLISGRNAELLIGKHVAAAPALKRSQLEIIPTGYMLVDGGTLSSVAYMSNTIPLPANKPDIARCTAMAGEMLGLQTIYLDAGSGAKHPVPPEIIQAVAETTQIPLIVGGGLRNPQQMVTAFQAGADMVVIGTATEQNPSLILDMHQALHAAFPAFAE